ncbi:NmrA family NAD(P)-binding protein [Solitalea sp. MAHUQ-68]|uniref:NmrA family NAD(P)-binding protein n=1 Tax=Solitalea agri TaxID=2953739 RepID=A0A9X2JF17_9SPHI|nr:NmrA family NAD(P)-binding protein [Solitalea agri]MCO4292946.1 NmrA family NAD(P)-binding protein [Solitalea agri]
MKIIVTGSLGNISKPLTQLLVQDGHSVIVISSNDYKRTEIELLGAKAAIGSIDDLAFLKTVFKGADAIYCMIPPDFAAPDQVDYYSCIGTNYTKAIEHAGVKQVVELSSYGAHRPSGTGFIVGSNRVEQLFNALKDVNVMHMRPGYFYYNLLTFIPMIKATGRMAANFDGKDKLPLVSPLDIAAAVAEELTKQTFKSGVRYVVSDNRTCNEIAGVLGKAINLPELQWKTISDAEMQHNLERNGMSPATAAALVELGAATHNGILREHMNLQEITHGKVTLESFAKDFAVAYKQNQMKY